MSSSRGRGGAGNKWRGQRKASVKQLMFCKNVLKSPQGECSVLLSGGSCLQLHVCPAWLACYCYRESKCRWPHSILDPHNKAVVDRLYPSAPPDCEMRRRKFVSNLFPRLCVAYNYSSVCKNPKCTYLHICRFVVRPKGCQKKNCTLQHNVLDPKLRHYFHRFNIQTAQLSTRQIVGFIIVPDPYSPHKLRESLSCRCYDCMFSGDTASVVMSELDFLLDDFRSIVSSNNSDSDSSSEDELSFLSDSDEDSCSDEDNDTNLALFNAAKLSNDGMNDLLSNLNNLNASLDDNAPALTYSNVLKFFYVRNGSVSYQEFMDYFDLSKDKSFDLENWRNMLDKNCPGGKSYIDIYFHPKLKKPDFMNIYQKLFICENYNNPKGSCSDDACEKLHLCLWYLADPNGKVHKKKCLYGLCHDLTGRNQRIRGRLMELDIGYKQNQILEILRSAHPKVCSAFNAGFCKAKKCKNLHVCNNIMYRENLGKKCPCNRPHGISYKGFQNQLVVFGDGLESFNPVQLRWFIIPAPLPNSIDEQKPVVEKQAVQSLMTAPNRGRPGSARGAAAGGKPVQQEFVAGGDDNCNQFPPFFRGGGRGNMRGRGNFVSPPVPPQGGCGCGPPPSPQIERGAYRGRGQVHPGPGTQRGRGSAFHEATVATRGRGSVNPKDSTVVRGRGASRGSASGSSVPSQYLCESFLRNKCSNQNCGMFHSTFGLPYLWQWQNRADSWVNFSPRDNAEIEESYCNPRRAEWTTVFTDSNQDQLHGQVRLTFSTHLHELVCVGSNQRWPVRCLRTKPRLLALAKEKLSTEYVWYVFDRSSDSWLDLRKLLSSDGHDTVEEEFCANSQSCQIDSVVGSQVQKVRFDFKNSIATLLMSNQSFPLSRRPALQKSSSSQNDVQRAHNNPNLNFQGPGQFPVGWQGQGFPQPHGVGPQFPGHVQQNFDPQQKQCHTM